MMRTIRRGLGAGRGSGYKNLIKGHDSKVHHDSGHGIKQPQRVGLSIALPQKNLMVKMRTKENPYEIWKSADGTWEWRVMKKYQADDNKP